MSINANNEINSFRFGFKVISMEWTDGVTEEIFDLHPFQRGLESVDFFRYFLRHYFNLGCNVLSLLYIDSVVAVETCFRFMGIRIPLFRK